MTPKFYERRSVDMDEMVYNSDGTIQNRTYFSVEGPKQVGVLDPLRVWKLRQWPGAKA